MLPTLEISREELFKNGFINAFAHDVDAEYSPDNSIYLLFKPKDLRLFKEFLDGEYDRTKDVIEDYDYEGGYVVVVYQLPYKFKEDYNLVKEGKYSKTSKKFQKVFPTKVKVFKNPNLGEQTSLQYMIFNKDSRLIEFWEDKLGESTIKESMEFWSTYEESREILNIKQIRKDE